MVNKVILIGNVGKDPEVKALPSGLLIANLSLATSFSWKDSRDGTRKEKSEWHKISIYNDNVAKMVQSYVKKGTKLYIEGSIASGKYNDQSGVERKYTYIEISKYNGTIKILSSSGHDAGENAGSSSYAEDSSDFGGGSDSPYGGGDVDDEIPF